MARDERHERADGFYRAVCKNEACRASNRQRTYWRSAHSSERHASLLAREHNRAEHPEVAS